MIPPKDTHHQNQSEKNRRESKKRERKRSANIVRAFFAREHTKISFSAKEKEESFTRFLGFHSVQKKSARTHNTNQKENGINFSSETL